MLKHSLENIYKIYTPDTDKTPLIPLVFDSPHSGRTYPEDFDYVCPRGALINAEDNDVDTLFDVAPAYGATLLCAEFPRTYIDVNRAGDDIDLDLLDDNWGDIAQSPAKPTARSHAGIGLIRRLVKPGMPLYGRKLKSIEILDRIEKFYAPYHDALSTLIEDKHYNFGQVWHVNCHSMPSKSARISAVSHNSLSLFSDYPDFVLGDRNGTTCHADFTRSMRDFLKGLGYRVAINNPYRGVELVRRYASPATGRHSIQIEINKALYWDEEKHKRSKNYKSLKEDLNKLIGFCASYVDSNLVQQAAD